MKGRDKMLAEEMQGSATMIEGNQGGKRLFLESYGCAMNFSDSEIVASVLSEHGYSTVNDIESADLILVNTCSIIDKAEQTVRNRLDHFKHLKKNNRNLKVGVLGCMAERLKSQLLEEEKLVDLVVGGEQAAGDFEPGRVGVFGGHTGFGDARRYWDFRSVGRGDINFEEIIVALNDVGYNGPLSVEWEDIRMDRVQGATESADFCHAIDFGTSNVAFDAAFDK